MTPSEAVSRVREVLTPDLLHRDYRSGWSPENPTHGHCAAASEAVYFLLGGPKTGLTAWVARDADGTTHWWLQTVGGERIDPTADQYSVAGRVPPYLRGILGKPGGFMGQRVEIGNRYGFDRRPGKVAAEILRRIETAYRRKAN